jgi:hypothetical protein
LLLGECAWSTAAAAAAAAGCPNVIAAAILLLLVLLLFLLYMLFFVFLLMFLLPLVVVLVVLLLLWVCMKTTDSTSPDGVVHGWVNLPIIIGTVLNNNNISILGHMQVHTGCHVGTRSPWHCPIVHGDIHACHLAIAVLQVLLQPVHPCGCILGSYAC